MLNYNRMVEQVAAGKDPAILIESEMQNSFQDRSDDIQTPEAAAAAFEKIAREYGGALPNVGPDWITVIADQVKTNGPEGMAELKRMAYDNREQYSGARIDSGGSFQLWDAVLKGLTAVMTDQLPPPAPSIG